MHFKYYFSNKIVLAGRNKFNNTLPALISFLHIYRNEPYIVSVTV